MENIMIVKETRIRYSKVNHNHHAFYFTIIIQMFTMKEDNETILTKEKHHQYLSHNNPVNGLIIIDAPVLWKILQYSKGQ